MVEVCPREVEQQGMAADRSPIQVLVVFGDV